MILEYSDARPACFRSLISHIESIQSQDLTGALDVVARGNGCLFDINAEGARFRDLDERAGQPTAREVAKTMDFDSRVEHLPYQSSNRRAITFNRALEGQPFARRQNRDAVPAKITREKQIALGVRALFLLAPRCQPNFH